MVAEPIAPLVAWVLRGAPVDVEGAATAGLLIGEVSGAPGVAGAPGGVGEADVTTFDDAGTKSGDAGGFEIFGTALPAAGSVAVRLDVTAAFPTGVAAVPVTAEQPADRHSAKAHDVTIKHRVTVRCRTISRIPITVPIFGVHDPDRQSAASV